MKYIRFIMTLFCIALCFSLSAFAAQTVYLDGVGSDENCYATLVDAFTAVDGGGTVVVTAPIEGPTSSATTLPAKDGTVTVTSVYDGVDYDAENGAYYGIGRTLNLSSPVVFDDILLKQTSGSTTYGNIYACGNTLTVGAGVTTAADPTTGLYTNIYGGNSSGVFTGNTRLIISGGSWNNIFGGSYQSLKGNSVLDIYGGTFNNVYGGTRDWHFTGDATVNFYGGTVLGTLAGGNGPNAHNFIGNITLNVTGGTVQYNASAPGLVGGCVGRSTGGDSGTVKGGRITVNIGGDADICSTILGASRYTNITTQENIEVNVGGNATVRRHIYGGGYGNVLGDISVDLSGDITLVKLSGTSNFLCAGAVSGTVTGNVEITCDVSGALNANIYGGGYGGNVTGNAAATLTGGTVMINFSAGSRGGTVSGSATTRCLGGRLSGASYGARGSGGDNGKVTGAAHVLLDGTEIAGSITLGTVGAGSTVTLKSGSVGAVVPNSVTVDLSGGATLSLGSSVVADSFTGGGRLILAAAASVTTETLVGQTELELVGMPIPSQAYFTITDTAATGAVSYTPVDDGILDRVVHEDSIQYIMTYTDHFDSTHVRINYYNPLGESEQQPNIVLYSGAGSSATKITAGVTGGSEAGRAYIEADLAPGLYYYKVYYNGSSDYIIKRFFLDGRSETATYDCPFEPFVENAYMEKTVMVTTDQILENFYGTDDLVGYKTPDTPTFALHADDRRFMSNGELCAYTEALAENCAYLHLFILDLETETNRMPVLLFTKDEIPEGATLEETAEIVRGGGVREIMMISGGKHGNEPAGEEGVLDFAADLAGDYGNGVLDAFGAIVVIPATSVDNLQRFTRTYPDGVNPNRDMISLSHEDCRKEAYIYTLFMPTVRVDCHEDTSGTVSVEADYSQSNLADVCFQYNGVPNAPLTDAYGIADGTAPLLSQGRRSVLDRLISRVDALGLRGAHYQWPYYTPGMSDAYGAVRGSYGFLIEVMRILSGKSHYARAVFAMKEGLKALTAEIIATSGEMASEVAAARAAAAVTTFDEHNIFVTGMSLGGSGLYNVGKYPSVYVDGTYKDADNLRSYSRYDTVTASRPMPTAYVLPADAEQIGAVLAKLDEHGLTYEKIKAGSKLTLKRYTLGSSVSYGAAQEVTFDAGAYVFLTDTSDAYLMAYLFEPDSYVSSDTVATSLYQAGLIADGDALYRSETDGMRLLIEDMLEKTVAGDVNGDGVVGLADALHALRAMLNGQPLSAADLDGNGVITLVDILKILKACAA